MKDIELLQRHDVTRRDALKLLTGGIAALAAGCQTRAGDEEIVPYVDVPPELRPGVAMHYASMLVLDGFATGVIVEAHDGRPTKIDGNPAHPASLGGSTAWMQARILDLYDPQRSQAARLDGALASWQAVRQRLAATTGPLWTSSTGHRSWRRLASPDVMSSSWLSALRRSTKATPRCMRPRSATTRRWPASSSDGERTCGHETGGAPNRSTRR